MLAESRLRRAKYASRKNFTAQGECVFFFNRQALELPQENMPNYDESVSGLVEYLFNCLAHNCSGADYGKEKGNFHEYNYKSASFGNIDDAGAWDAARSHLACSSAPGQSACGAPGRTIESNLVGNNPVTQYMPNRDVIINGTSQGHVLNDGYVVRWVAPDSSGAVRIWTYGIGNNTNFATQGLNYVAGQNFRVFDNSAAMRYRASKIGQ